MAKGIILGQDYSQNYLSVSGGKMNGNIDMGNNKITNLKDPSEELDAVNYKTLKLYGGTWTLKRTDSKNVSSLNRGYSITILPTGIVNLTQDILITMSGSITAINRYSNTAATANLFWEINSNAVFPIFINNSIREQFDKLIMKYDFSKVAFLLKSGFADKDYSESYHYIIGGERFGHNYETETTQVGIVNTGTARIEDIKLNIRIYVKDNDFKLKL